MINNKNRNFDIIEEFVKELFKQQIKGIEMLEPYFTKAKSRKILIGDFLFKIEEKKYIVEVKSRFSSTYLNRTLEYMNSFSKDCLDIDSEVIKIVVVLDKIPESYKRIAHQKYQEISLFDISNVLYIINGNENLLLKLNGLINFSVENIIPQKPNIDFEIKETEYKIYKKDYIELLEGIEPGNDSAKKYEKLIGEIIKILFSDKLGLFFEQSRTEYGINIFDMICKIKNNVDDEFFTTIEKYFNSKYILFEYKNYDDLIGQGEIHSTEKYLYKTALRNVAIIITRRGINENGRRTIEGILRETGRLIIVLNDEDIKEMINLYNKNKEISIILENKLDELLVHIEK